MFLRRKEEEEEGERGKKRKSPITYNRPMVLHRRGDGVPGHADILVTDTSTTATQMHNQTNR
jgi:hypothetical protein